MPKKLPMPPIVESDEDEEQEDESDEDNDLDGSLDLDELEEKPKANPNPNAHKPYVKPASKPRVEGKSSSERYVAFYQPERCGVIDTLTNKTFEGLTPATAEIEAFKLNEFDKINRNIGAQ